MLNKEVSELTTSEKWQVGVFIVFGLLSLISFFAWVGGAYTLPFEYTERQKVEQKWCKEQGGEYSEGWRNSTRTHRYARDSCEVPKLKGKAGIEVGNTTYHFEAKIIDYDTGLTEVTAHDRSNISRFPSFSVYNTVTGEVIHRDKKPEPVLIGKFITKGKYN